MATFDTREDSIKIPKFRFFRRCLYGRNVNYLALPLVTVVNVK